MTKKEIELFKQQAGLLVALYKGQIEYNGNGNIIKDTRVKNVNRKSKQ